MRSWHSSARGAIGKTLGAYLARAGRDITLIDMWAAHADEMVQRGLKVTAPDEEFTVKVKAVHLAEASRLRETFDAVLQAGGVLICAGGAKSVPYNGEGVSEMI